MKPLYSLYALGAAALFGLSAPMAKIFVTDLSIFAVSAFLYLGSGLGLSVVMAFRFALSRGEKKGFSGFRSSDYPWFAASIVVGGIAAPLSLLFGLSRTGAGVASLLLSTEGVLTALLAASLFKESVGRQTWLALPFMFAAAVVLGFDSSNPYFVSPWALFIVLACFLWGLDNNITRKISHCDALAISSIKGVVAGSFNLALAVLFFDLPSHVGMAYIATVGFVCYGVSQVLFVFALRHMGAARTSAYFGSAPFFGAAASIALLHEPLSLPFFVALVLIAFATLLLLTERHEHEHMHEAIRHTHIHTHDIHHDHGHDDIKLHSHEHVHEPITHSHAHMPDIHHMHKH